MLHAGLQSQARGPSITGSVIRSFVNNIAVFEDSMAHRFSELDVNGTGRLTLNDVMPLIRDIAQLMGRPDGEQEVFSWLDPNEDDTIDQREFIQACRVLFLKLADALAQDEGDEREVVTADGADALRLLEDDVQLDDALTAQFLAVRRDKGSAMLTRKVCPSGGSGSMRGCWCLRECVCVGGGVQG